MKHHRFSQDEQLRAREFFLARQPILDANESVVAYELLFRRAQTETAEVVDDLSATASVIAHAAELGINNVIGSKSGFVNVDAAVLDLDIVSFLPAEKVVLEVLETVEVTPGLVQRVAELVAHGYVFALDDVICRDDALQPLLPFVRIIKIDITEMDQDRLAALVRYFQSLGKHLLAEKVESCEQFEYCRELGFDYFQGYYFARPVILSGKKLTPSQLTILQLMALISRDADTVELEQMIKKEALLAMNLLRLANAPAFGAVMQIESLGQALAMLGRAQLQRWLQILLYAEQSKGSYAGSPLLQLATTRGKLLELIAESMSGQQACRADIAFTVGVMSLMDTLLGQPMQEILQKITVVDEMRDALLFRRGIYGDILKLAEYLERIEQTVGLLPALLKRLGLTADELYELELQAFEWSNNVSEYL